MNIKIQRFINKILQSLNQQIRQTVINQNADAKWINKMYIERKILHFKRTFIITIHKLILYC